MVLMGTTVMAILIANSPWGALYTHWTGIVAHPINDGLMVIFFWMVGMEIKREMVEGELSTWKEAALPLIGALGGVVLPALIFSYFNWGSNTMRGWAIPCATDIAFSLGVIALFGSRVPMALKIFLMALAVIDDLVAVIIIAVFYTNTINVPALMVAIGSLLILWHMNRSGIMQLLSYVLVGGMLWVAVLLSGVHATIAGVLLGMMMPGALGKRCIDGLHPWVAYGIIPLFAFANAGIPLVGISANTLVASLPLGILLGLFAGKQLGIFLCAWLAIKLKLATKLRGVSWLTFYAVSIIAGIGFTMSLFIGSLAFADTVTQIEVRRGVIVGSLLSALVGSMLLWISTRGSLSKD